MLVGGREYDMKKKYISLSEPVEQSFYGHTLTAKQRDELERDRVAIEWVISQKYIKGRDHLKLIELWITRVEKAIENALPFKSKR